MGSKYPQKIYTAEFKREAGRLLETSGKRGVQISQDQISPTVVSIHGGKLLAEQDEEAFLDKAYAGP